MGPLISNEGRKLFMKTLFFRTVAAFGFACLVSSPPAAETMEGSGTLCWNGDIDYVATTEKDMGYTWSLDFTVLADGDTPALNSSGTCHGSGVIVDATPEALPYFCRHVMADGAIAMSRAEYTSTGIAGVLFGGATGAYEGGAAVSFPVAEGKIAGCRPMSITLTLPG
jgi:hypothetical protein